jgi:outer membrane protein OmpA-like peptidoglycan-associated protein
MRIRPSRPALLLAPLLVLAAGCGNLLDDVPPRPAAIEDQATADAAFPSLAAVPARPQLTYTLEQRREIAQGLVGDRANARYAGDELRRAQGRPVQPDTAPPLPPVAAPAPPAGARPGDLALAYVEEALARDSDDGSLGDFLDRLQQRPPAVADILPPPAAVPPEAVAPEPVAAEPVLPGPVAVEPVAVEPVAPEPVAPEPVAPEPVAAERVAAEPVVVAPVPEGDRAVAAATGGGTAPGTAESAPGPAAAPAQPAPLPPPSLPLSILFEADVTDLRGDDRARLDRLARGAAQGEAAIVVSGGGKRPGLAMERARRVAAALVGGGLPPTRIAIEMGGESDVVVVYEAGT